MKIFHQPIVADPTISQMISFKANLIWEIRKYLHDLDAWEIPMPILQHTREGAPIDQWSSIHPHTGQRWYLRHCMEDHLRRLSIAHKRVFEIGKAIRADAISPIHAHEFVVLELVFRGLNYDDGVDLVKGLLAGPIAKVVDDEYGSGNVFRQVTVRKWDTILKEVTGLSTEDSSFIDSCESWLKAHGIMPIHPYSRNWEVVEDIMKYVIEPACVSPTIITYFPRDLQHVCDINLSDESALRVSSVINGVEISDGGVKFADSSQYRRIYAANAEYRQNILGLEGNELPEEFFADLDVLPEPAFTTGLGIDRITALMAGSDITRALIFPEG